MKLAELLARELEEWPEVADVAVQDLDENVYFNESARSIEYESEEMGAWSEVNGRSGWIDEWITASFLATDHATAIVTREMWEAERAKLASTAEWDGEGLPPVGAVCEHQGDNEDYNSLFPVLILAHAKVDDRYVAVFQRTDDDIEISFSDAVFFRPIRTPEQIAAQEREESIDKMVGVSPLLDKAWSRTVCAALYDAGYRKQEQSE